MDHDAPLKQVTWMTNVQDCTVCCSSCFEWLEMACQGYGSQKRSCLHWVNCKNSCYCAQWSKLLEEESEVKEKVWGGLRRCAPMTHRTIHNAYLRYGIDTVWRCDKAPNINSTFVVRLFLPWSFGAWEKVESHLSAVHTSYELKTPFRIFREHRKRSEHHRAP